MKLLDLESFFVEQGMDETMRVLGVNSRQAVYYHLRKRTDIIIEIGDTHITAKKSVVMNRVPIIKEG